LSVACSQTAADGGKKLSGSSCRTILEYLSAPLSSPSHARAVGDAKGTAASKVPESMGGQKEIEPLLSIFLAPGGFQVIQLVRLDRHVRKLSASGRAGQIGGILVYGQQFSSDLRARRRRSFNNGNPWQIRIQLHEGTNNANSSAAGFLPTPERPGIVGPRCRRSLQRRKETENQQSAPGIAPKGGRGAMF